MKTDDEKAVECVEAFEPIFDAASRVLRTETFCIPETLIDGYAEVLAMEKFATGVELDRLNSRQIGYIDACRRMLGKAGSGMLICLAEDRQLAAEGENDGKNDGKRA